MLCCTARPSPSSWREKTAAAGFVTAVRFWWVQIKFASDSLTQALVCLCVCVCDDMAVRHVLSQHLWGDQYMWITDCTTSESMTESNKNSLFSPLSSLAKQSCFYCRFLSFLFLSKKHTFLGWNDEVYLSSNVFVFIFYWEHAVVVSVGTCLALLILSLVQMELRPNMKSFMYLFFWGEIRSQLLSFQTSDPLFFQSTKLSIKIPLTP